MWQINEKSSLSLALTNSWKSHHKSEMHLQLYQTSMMELFVKTVED